MYSFTQTKQLLQASLCKFLIVDISNIYLTESIFILQRIIGSDGRNAAHSFRGHTLSMADPQYGSRTYYFVTSSNTEQQEWVDAINTNIKAYQVM